jgi:hypothetical protein
MERSTAFAFAVSTLLSQLMMSLYSKYLNNRITAPTPTYGDRVA